MSKAMGRMAALILVLVAALGIALAGNPDNVTPVGLLLVDLFL